MSLLAGLFYLLCLIVIGVLATRRTQGAEDYFLAGRRLRLIPAVLATMSSIMSGFVFVGGPGLFYATGLASFWITISSSFTGALMCWVLARPFHELSRESGSLTIPDLIHARYKCRFCSALAGLGIFIGVIGYLATQLSALGVLLGSILPVSTGIATLLAVGVLIFYTVAGGMVASVYTDVLQGIIMLWATTLVFYFALQSTGGVSRISTVLLQTSPETLDPWGTVGVFGALSWFLVFSLGSLGQPHVVTKFMMLRSLKTLKYFPLVLAVSMLLCGLIWLSGGLAVKSLVMEGRLAPLEHPDAAITTFLAGYTPAWLSALVYVGIIAAVMSTADSFANIGAAVLTRDWPQAFSIPVVRQLSWARVATLALFLLSLSFAYWMQEMVAYLGIFAFGSFAAALTPSLALGMNWREAGRLAAASSLVVGIALNAGLELVDRFLEFDFLVTPSLVALSVSFLTFICVGLAEQRGRANAEVVVGS